MTIQRFLIFGCLTLFSVGLLHAGRQNLYHLGPTGLSGSIQKNKIIIEKVEKGSPAANKVYPKMVLLGVGNKTFTSNPRKELAAAIDYAESKKGKGRLVLLFDLGKQKATSLDKYEKVVLQLEVLGEYSATAPYNCPKTNAILKKASQMWQADEEKHKKSKRYRGPKITGGLGLRALSTMAIEGKVGAQKLANVDWGEPGPPTIYKVWRWSYRTITMCEYYLLTNDKKVLPKIREYAIALSRGQDAGGLWGHTPATPERNGRLPGYAQMNQSSIAGLMALALTRKCGINDPIINQALNKTYTYYKSYIGKGAFPYGVHGFNTKSYNNNGTSASAALAMMACGNNEGAQFFGRLATAAHNNLESGHACYKFNPLWSPLGAAVLGPKATIEYVKETRWLYTMYRSWDGSIKEVRDTRLNDGLVLFFALGKRNIFITGKGHNKSAWVSGQAAKDAINVSKISYNTLSNDQLFELCKHDLPQVRRRANWELGLRRKKDNSIAPKYKKLIESSNKLEKRSSVGSFGMWCEQDLRVTMTSRIGKFIGDKNQSLVLRVTAATAISHHGQAAYKYYDDILALLNEEKPSDPLGDFDQALGGSLLRFSKDPFKDGLVNIKNKPLFYKGCSKLLKHKRHSGRSPGVALLLNMPKEDFHHVADLVLHVAMDNDPTYHSYHNKGPIANAIRILARFKIKEGIPATLSFAHKSGRPLQQRILLKILPLYGQHARALVNDVRAIKHFKKHKQDTWDKILKVIESDKSNSKLISIAEAKKLR